VDAPAAASQPDQGVVADVQMKAQVGIVRLGAFDGVTVADAKEFA
jgi:hypothetical protein